MSILPPSLFRPVGAPPRMKALSRHRPSIVSVLDIGTSKVCCLVARLTPRDDEGWLPGRTHRVEVIGVGHQRSQGVKSGVIVDVERAEGAVRQAVAAAEKMAGVTVESLVVNVSCGRIGSSTFSAEIAMNGREVEGVDIRAVLRDGAETALRERAAAGSGAGQRIALHSLPIGFSLDGERDIRDPRGMAAERLGVDMHVVDAEAAPARNLEIAVNRAHLSVDAMVATPFASGLAALVDDEAQMGAACIDMGAGTTTVSVFLHGRFVWADALALGGAHVTRDLARGLGTRVDDAERIKVLHGSVRDESTAGPFTGSVRAAGFDEDSVIVPPMSDDDRDVSTPVSKSDVAAIITPRVEETLEMVRDRLVRSGFASAIGGRVVLTGGASALPGMVPVADRILAARVRLGRPLGVGRLPAAAKGPAFAAAAGLLIYPQVAGLEEFASAAPQSAASAAPTAAAAARGPLGRWGAWLKTI